MNALPTTSFLKNLRAEIAAHPGVSHVFLARLACTPFTRQDYKVFGLQHYPLVGLFTTYMEHLLLNAPDSGSKLWLARVLVDEYGEGSDGDDHATLYQGFLTACGAAPGEEDTTPLDPAVVSFIRTHLRLTTRAPFLVGLGALGPGHEWSIPRMFELIIEGQQRAGFSDDEINYFTLHVAQDEDHGAWLEEALGQLIQSGQDRDDVRRGAMESLEARAHFWEGVQSCVVRWRQPEQWMLREKARAWVGDRRDRLPWLPRRLAAHSAIYRPQVRALARGL